MAKRRTYGTGSVTELGDGRWLLRTSHRSTETGERIRVNKVVEARNRKEAESLLAGMSGTRVAEGRPHTWTLDRWFRHVFSNRELAPKSREVATQLWELYASPALKATPLSDVGVEDIDREMDRLRSVKSRYYRPLSPRTRTLWFANLRRALNVAVAKRVIASNPALLTDRRPKQEKHEIRRWGAGEAAKFLAVASSSRLAALWRLLLETGMRPAEAFGLRWSDLSGNVVTVRRTVVRLKDGTINAAAPTKAYQTRECRLSEAMVAALKAHKARQAEERLQAGPHYHADLDLVFGTELGQPLRNDVVHHTFARLAKQAGVQPLPLYGLRHTSASLKLELGVDLQTVSEGLGHKNAATTIAHYLKSSPAQQQKATDVLAAALAQ